jgi:hypothetical protein
MFFLVAAAMCALALAITPDDLRWVGIVLIVTYVVLAGASQLDHHTRRTAPARQPRGPADRP